MLTILTAAVSGLFGLSFILNVVLFLKLKKPVTTQTQEARDVLRDILGSGAVLEIKLLDKSSFFVRSPRG